MLLGDCLIVDYYVPVDQHYFYTHCSIAPDSNNQKNVTLGL